MSTERRYLAENFGRLKRKAANFLGVVFKGETSLSMSTDEKCMLWRRPELEVCDRYLKNTQYDHLPVWNSDISAMQHDKRETQPRNIIPIPDIATEKISTYLSGEESRLSFFFEEYEEQELFNNFLEKILFWNVIQDILPSLLVNGSTFIRFYKNDNGNIIIIPYNSKWVYPEFSDENELEKVEIKYIYVSDELDASNNYVYKWSRLMLYKDKDVKYKDVVYEHGQNPKFEVEKTIEHKLGFVQGEWFKTHCSSEPHIVDGKGLLNGSMEILDALNYRSSKEDASAFFHLLPSMVSYGIDPETLAEDMRVRRREKDRLHGLNLFATEKRPGDAQLHFLEPSGVGFGAGDILYTRGMQLLQHIIGFTLLEPEKIAAHAQSGIAMKMLHKPIIEYVQRIRPYMKYSIKSILTKIINLCIMKNMNNLKDYNSCFNKFVKEDVECKWGNFFDNTIQDIHQKVAYTATAVQSGLISKDTGLKHISSDFDIKNAEEEMEKVQSDKAQEMEDEQLFNRGNNNATE